LWYPGRKGLHSCLNPGKDRFGNVAVLSGFPYRGRIDGKLYVQGYFSLLHENTDYFHPSVLYFRYCSACSRLHQSTFTTCIEHYRHYDPPVVTTGTIGTVQTTGTLETIRTTGTQDTPTTWETPTFTSTTSPGITIPSPTEDKGQRIRIKAKNLVFDVSRITVPASSQVIVEFENEDTVAHNVAFYTTSSLASTI